jgi:hypothetical protein
MRWISVKDRLPEEDTPVLVFYLYTAHGEEYYLKMGEILYGPKPLEKSYWHIDNSNFDCLEDDKIEVLYWIPLPDRPERLNPETSQKDDAIV